PRVEEAWPLISARGQRSEVRRQRSDVRDDSADCVGVFQQGFLAARGPAISSVAITVAVDNRSKTLGRWKSEDLFSRSSAWQVNGAQIWGGALRFEFSWPSRWQLQLR